MIDLLAQNQFAQGGILLAVAAAGWRYASGVVSLLRTQVERRVMVTLEINSDDPLWPSMSRWVASQPWAKKGSSYGVAGYQTTGGGSGSVPPATSYGGTSSFGKPVAAKEQIPLNPTDPCFGRWRDRILFWNAWRYKREGGGNAYVWSATIKLVPGRIEDIISLIEEIEAFNAAETVSGISVYKAHDCWDFQRIYPKRPMSSVVTGISDDLLADAKAFIGRQEHYLRAGIPWRRGYLLSGPPGTGKSSIAFALASELDASLYLLTIGPRNSDHLDSLMGNVHNAVMVIEDIDTAGIDVKRDESGRGTLAPLLNAIDGTASSHGRILILTTNHPERLDPALIRPGRVDRHFHLGLATPEHVSTRARQVLSPERAEAFLAAYLPSMPPHGVTMAEVQNQLFQHLD